MNEEKGIKATEQGKAAADNGAGNNKSAIEIIDAANAAAERLELANKRTEELLRTQQELETRRILGGRSEGTIPEKPKEETPKEYADRVLKNIQK